MEIKHENPALLLEWYKVSVSLTNLEDRPVSDVCLNLSLNRNNNEKIELSSACFFFFKSLISEYYNNYNHGFIAEICEDTEKNLLSLPVDFKLDSMHVGDQKTQCFYVRSSSLDTRYFQLMVSKLFNLYHSYFTTMLSIYLINKYDKI